MLTYPIFDRNGVLYLISANLQFGNHVQVRCPGATSFQTNLHFFHGKTELDIFRSWVEVSRRDGIALDRLFDSPLGAEIHPGVDRLKGFHPRGKIGSLDFGEGINEVGMLHRTVD